MDQTQQPASQPGPLDHPGARPQQPVAASGRPVGVALVAIMFLFYAIVVAVNGWSALQAFGATNLSSVARSDLRLDLALAVVQLPFYLVTAIGVWRMRRWGQYLALIFLALNIVRFVIEAFGFPQLRFGLLAALSRSIIPLAIMLYLLHPSIRHVFRAGRE